MSGVTPEDRHDFMQASIDDLNAALGHLGFDNMDDFHQWALDESELKRFDQLCLLLTRHRQAAYAAGVAAERGKSAAMLEALREAEFELSQVDWRFAGVNLKATLTKIRAAIAAATEGGA